MYFISGGFIFMQTNASEKDRKRLRDNIMKAVSCALVTATVLAGPVPAAKGARLARMDLFRGAAVTAYADSAQGSMSNFVRGREQSFSDLWKVDWCADWVRPASAYGIVKGDPEGTFRPDERLSVGEAVTIAARMASIYRSGSADALKAADGEDWSAPFLAYAKATGLVGGEFDGQAGRDVTRAEFVHALYNVLPASEYDAAANQVSSLPDVDPGTRYGGEVEDFYRYGVVAGDSGTGAFRPSDGLTRAEAAAVFLCMVEPARRTSGASYGGAAAATPAPPGDGGAVPEWSQNYQYWASGEGHAAGGLSIPGRKNRWGYD
jgi:hypothetical protein